MSPTARPARRRGGPGRAPPAAVDRRRSLRRRDRAVLVQRGDREPLGRRGRVLRQPAPAAPKEPPEAGYAHPGRAPASAHRGSVSCRPTNIAHAACCLRMWPPRAVTSWRSISRHRRGAEEPGRHRGRSEFTTDYPADGTSRPAATGASLTLGLRALVRGRAVTVNARWPRLPSRAEPLLSRTWAAGDVVTLSLPMPARFTWPDPRIDAVRGQVAVERGPLVHCLESADLGADVEEAAVDGPLGCRWSTVTCWPRSAGAASRRCRGRTPRHRWQGRTQARRAGYGCSRIANGGTGDPERCVCSFRRPDPDLPGAAVRGYLHSFYDAERPSRRP